MKSIRVRFGETWTIRARPRTLSDTVVECVSRIHTAAPDFRQYRRIIVAYEHSLSDVPDPLKMASRPVASIAATIADGAAGILSETFSCWTNGVKTDLCLL